MAYREMKDWERAADEIGTAGTLTLEVGDMIEQTKLSFEQGLLCKAMNETGEARGCLDKTMDEFQRMGMKSWIGKCRAALESLDDEAISGGE